MAVETLQKIGLDLETTRREVEKLSGAKAQTEMVGSIPYTPRVKKVLALAGREALSHNHTYVGTEHILLGLLEETEGAAAHVLKAFQVDLERMRGEIRRHLSGCPEAANSAPDLSPSRINFSPRALEALNFAEKEAVRLNEDHVGTKHLLLALTHLSQGGAAALLRRKKLDPAVIRLEVEKQADAEGELPLAGKTSITLRLQKAIAYAGKEVMSLKCAYVGTEHLLLGLMREGTSGAARALENLGLEFTWARGEVASTDFTDAEGVREEG